MNFLNSFTDNHECVMTYKDGLILASNFGKQIEILKPI